VALLVTATLTPCQQADLNGNGSVDVFDLRLLSRVLGSKEGDENYSATYDLNGNGEIDVLDLRRVSSQYGQTCSANE
jgi:Ca2+-binding EF-hand superfamily protein